MPRTPVGAVARLDRISVRATESEMRDIERLRGAMSIADYIRKLVRDDVQRTQVRAS